jgi:hypothetical protein
MSPKKILERINPSITLAVCSVHTTGAKMLAPEADARKCSRHGELLGAK